MAWGVAQGDWSPTQLAIKIRNAGLKWVAFESWRWNVDRYMEACEAHGLRVGLWEQGPTTDDAIDDVLDLDPSFYIANIEGDHERTRFNPQKFRTEFPSLECGVITNFGGFAETTNEDVWKARAKPWVDARFNCIPEAYMNESHNYTPTNLDDVARRCGWPATASALGVYWGFPLATYKEHLINHHYSVYLAETMSDADWATLGEWNGSG